MDAVVFDIFDCAPLPVQPCAAAPTPLSTLQSVVHSFSNALKACLPRRMREPTGPFTLLFDMLLGIFVPHGACKTMIDKLPLEIVGEEQDDIESVVIPVKRGDKCAICLGPYEQGESVRHLTCNHAFHAECVDIWLEKRSLCPICKTHAC
ncbi:E3 ubiquitin-protein ligase RNF12 [Gracilariopsis chorda]|uniref:E3 ubiquitin-protein ligase RNF12 n=1 Tax=Gracilariopsis chorda TaxID=448386 RepID=A0A2V3IJU4_9FLOR|nr:E3 ubiquitin-protein ligase RNF12 [Gracilariopsis chorda]|eukprot:PXF42347.1 E3 ubiquitin-protein ligase RNF12 [Gracilariopsis chorda]